MSIDYITIEDKDWLYHTSSEKVRYSLGERGTKPLICFGINPSTAKPNALDNTLRQVQARACANNYDGWIMFNLYPLRATNPKNLPLIINKRMHKENIQCISNVISSFSANEIELDVWCAWGGIINQRKYLSACLCDIHSEIKDYKINWIALENSITKAGDPGHPLYKRKELKFVSFDIENYINKFR